MRASLSVSKRDNAAAISRTMSSLTAFSLSGRFSVIVAMCVMALVFDQLLRHRPLLPERPIVHYQGRTSSHVLW